MKRVMTVWREPDCRSGVVPAATKVNTPNRGR
jgi:hypothetical protein